MTEDTDPRVLEPGTAPTPFTAEEIRDGCRAGKTIRVRIEVVGEEPMLRQNRYLELDDEGATLERTLLSLDGSPTGKPEADRVTWRDLQSHASFPAAVTTIEPERIETPMGELDCLRYTVRDGALEKVFWFATTLPGMPVRTVTRDHGEAVMTVTMVSSSNV